MNKDFLENNRYEIYKEDEIYFYVKDVNNYYYNINKKAKSINVSCIGKNNIFSIQNIKQYIKNNNILVELLSDIFIDVNDKLCFKDINGHIFYRDWRHITRKHSVYMCPECTKIYIGKTRLIDKNQVKKEYKAKDLTILEEYKNNRIPILCKDKEGYLGKISRQNLTEGKTFNKFSILNQYTIYNINNYININNLPIKLLSTTYKGYESDLLWECECGNTFKRTLEELNRRKTYRCRKCTNRISNNENKISSFLNEYNIKYISEFKFKNCISLKMLPFDFYLPKYKLCIEVQGEQHYKPVTFGGRSFKESIEAFLKQKERDKIKEEYCLKNNVELLKIFNLDIQNNNYKKILSYKLNINR